MLADVVELIAQSHSRNAADEFSAFDPSDADFASLVQATKELQVCFKPVPGACVVMSALLIARVQSLTKTPVYMVAGTLSVARKRIFGTDGPIDGAKVFSQSAVSWDGHCWVQFGKYVVDTSLFRTAYSGKGDPALAAHVMKTHGANKSAPIATYEALANEDGLIYVPQYVLTQAQLEPITNGAFAVLDANFR
jgi:hypothetical protein